MKDAGLPALLVSVRHRFYLFIRTFAAMLFLGEIWVCEFPKHFLHVDGRQRGCDLIPIDKLVVVKIEFILIFFIVSLGAQTQHHAQSPHIYSVTADFRAVRACQYTAAFATVNAKRLFGLNHQRKVVNRDGMFPILLQVRISFME